MDTVGSTSPQIALLAPMQIELEPLVEQLMLRDAGDGTWRATVDGVPVVAHLTSIGMAPATDAAQRAIEMGATAVAVVGIAGGIDPAVVAIGEVIRPEIVLDRSSGRAHRPAPLGAGSPAGTLSCGDDLVTDPGRLAEMAQHGVIALDMETAAAAAVCEAAGVAWTVFRAVSDHAGAGLVSDEIFTMTEPDGSADPDAIAAYLARDPANAAVLERLARDAVRATQAAADACIHAMPQLIRLARG